MKQGLYNNFYRYLIDSFDKKQAALTYIESVNLTAKRNEAFSIFKEMGFPTRKYEEWKFTSLSAALKDELQLMIEHDHSLINTNRIHSLDAVHLVLVNGRFAPELSDALPEGITFYDTQATLAESRFADKISTLATEDDAPMLALNTAFFTEVSVLQIAAHAIVEKPVHVSHVFTVNDIAEFVPYRMLVIAEKHSEATIIETFHSDSLVHPLFVSYVCEQEVHESAVLHTHMINTLPENAYFVQHREVFQYRNSVLNNSNIALSDVTLLRNDLNFQLKDVGTETNLIGAYILTGDQHVDNHTLVDHQSPNCNTNEVYKGILLDTSHAVFNGKVFVRPDAQKTNAFQQNNNLLLSDQATVNSKPQLEIFADDVKCSHGSTIGQINEDALFYLQTRGIGEEAAKKLIMQSFIFDVILRIKIESLQDYVSDLLNKKLNTENLTVV
ncbi:Fe-S cluster assembly protein SufD [Arcticibacter eurypsychrophilus]|uniref:Fe-S cluster assembly protein SufD n=1 Tax=Arcticibacter eurypsychrophilus TaxID=1434752 RepID=UPI00084D69DC|nr:Fe-S cluster assembly protein SufD [Arcticibacter eurypsychrophilus]